MLEKNNNYSNNINNNNNLQYGAVFFSIVWDTNLDFRKKQQQQLQKQHK